MKKAISLMVLLAATALFAVPLFAKTKSIQFRAVLSEDEAKSAAHKKYSYVSHKGNQPRDLYVSDEALLSNADIDSMTVIRKENTVQQKFPEIDIVFNAKGAEKLTRMSEKNIRRSIAIFIDDKVIAAPYILHPLRSGHLMISSWQIDTLDAAKNLIGDLGFKPASK